MNNIPYYIWIIFLIIYIISPLDLFPTFFDDLIALGALVYTYYKMAKQRSASSYSQTRNRPFSRQQYSYKQQSFQGGRDDITLEEAYRMLDLSPDASWEEVNSAYKEKIVMCHPDKVSHLNKELQEKARELTLKLNSIMDIIKKHRKN
jgi:hypothetical protein